ncbi:hypothetical protein CDCA_CDCA12G3340 [Cyanidium caldarium]|uniref:Probable ATP-dependent transporter ycf16 n=1 Tax=Cyanidium caldarium TaxID=2771 RepID=A0AAV9IZ04_CYACA|nr:hypothetical protein CDCA_CDCA12G3340 [Cyanidium caldarium]
MRQPRDEGGSVPLAQQAARAVQQWTRQTLWGGFGVWERSDVDDASARKRRPPSLPERNEAVQELSSLETAQVSRRMQVPRIWVLFRKLSAPYWRESRTAKRDLAAVMALTLLGSGVSVAFSFIGRDFWTALSNRNPEQFTRELLLFLSAMVVGVPVVVSYTYARSRLGLRWRTWLTRRMLEQYFANRAFYLLETQQSVLLAERADAHPSGGAPSSSSSSSSLRAEVDNPDQRLTEDINAFTDTSLSFGLTVLTSIIDLAAFSTILFSIYPQLFGVLLLYSGCGTAVTVWLGRKLVQLNFLQLQREADFRYSLVRVRENAECVAFYNGQQREQSEGERRLKRAVDNQAVIITWQRNLELFTTSYRYLIQVLPAFVVAPLYFAGRIELGVIQQSYAAFNHILSDLSLVVNGFESLSAFGAGVDRLGEFAEALEAAAQLEAGGSGVLGRIDFRVVDATADARPLVMQSLTLYTPVGKQAVRTANDVAVLDGTVYNGLPTSASASEPERRVLFTDLTLALQPGERLLISGPSGVGKSSLLRAIAGLWRSGSGVIQRAPTEDTFFLPQKPYCTLGTLRQNLMYPSMPDDAGVHGLDDASVLRALTAAGLPDLPNRFVGGLDAERDWADVLSLGEQQRVSVVRLLLHRPRLIIGDEFTSALDEASEERVYRALIDTGASVVSVGHRLSLRRYHHRLLQLRYADTNGVIGDLQSACRWEVVSLQPETGVSSTVE